MNPDLEKNFPGKQPVPRLADIDLSLRFGLWKDYQRWLDPSEQTQLWYPSKILDISSVTLEVTLDQEQIIKHVYSDFITVDLHHRFDDVEARELDLRIKISNLNKLPVKNRDGVFVCGMFDISSLRVQGQEIKHLLGDTMVGTDQEITLSLSTPIYAWMLDHKKDILPGMLAL